MKKKITLLLSMLFFLCFFFFMFDSSSIPDSIKESQTLERGALSGQVRQAEKLIQSLPESLPKQEIHLCFQGEELACDQKNATWFLPVDMEEELWEAGEFTDSGKEIQILPLEDYTLLSKKETISQGRAVPFLAWKEKKAVCAVFSVVFTGLPVVRMETDANLEIDTVFAGSVTFYSQCAKEDWVTNSVFQAHERGQTTRAYPKKGYRVNLISVTSTGVINKNAQEIFEMRKSDSWIFYAIYSDGTKIRDKFNIELWNQFGASNHPYSAHYGTHMEYAELIVNGEYRGLYGILEPIDSKQLEISEQDYLYKRTFGRELLPELFDEADPEEYLTILGLELKGRDGAGTKEDWNCFRYFTEICEMDDDSFQKEAERLFNIDNITDIWLYLQMMYAEDNIYKNMFFVFKKEPAGYQMYLVPWDMDLTWGNIYVNSGEDLYVKKAPEKAEIYLEWPLADRLLALNVGQMQEKVKNRWAVLRTSVFSDENMKSIMEECMNQVQNSGAFARDARRWPHSCHDGDYKDMKIFMDKRMNILDNWLQK